MKIYAKKIARAGWGVFYGNDSPHNASQKFHGPVQTSYKAELRALLQVVRCVEEPVITMIDCKAVVNTVQKFLDHGEQGLDKLAEQDLWNYIFKICNRQPDFVRVQWMPSHLGEGGKKH